MEIFDTHCHLNDEWFQDDVHEVIHRAQEQYQVTHMMVIGIDRKTTMRALELAEQYEHIYVGVAWHPVDVVDCTKEDKQWLESIWQHKKVVAVAETGLDYYWDKSPKELQMEYFKWHVEQAIQRELPFVVHNRDAHGDTLKVLQDFYKTYGPLTGIMHSFSGSVEMAREFLKLGLHLSISGVVTFKNAKNIKEVVPIIPTDKILVETDAPYLTPTPFRGKRNEPGYTYYTLEEVARLRETPLETMAKITFENAKKLFKI